jgi:LacI family transcriptional regulator
MVRLMTAQPAPRVTLAMVAQEAQVSKALVSAFFSGKSYATQTGAGIGVADATRQRILEAARRLRYQPLDPHLLLEIYPEVGHYCFLVGSNAMSGFESYYSIMFAGAAEEMARDRGSLNLTLAQYDENVDYLAEPEQLPYAVRQGMTNKFILAGQPNYSLIMALLERGYHAIYLSRILQTKGVASVAPDYIQAGYLAMRHLIERGHRRIAVAGENYFTGMEFHLSHFVKGIRRALGEIGLEFGQDQVILSREPDNNRPTTTFDDVWRLDPRPTAVFCLCDWTAARLAREAIRAGVNVPQDLSVIGCNDQSTARDFAPALSSIRFPLRLMGAHAVEWFRTWTADHPPTPAQTVLPVQVVERESVRKL